MAKLPLGLMPNTADTPETSLERLRKMQEQMGLIRPTKTVEDAPEVPPVTEAVEKAELPKLPAMAEPAEMPAEAKPAGLDLLNRLKAAQEARRKQMQNIALLEGTSGISDAITRYYGAKPPSKTDYYKRLRAEADFPMQELMEEKKARDVEEQKRGEKAAAKVYKSLIQKARPNLEIDDDVPVEHLKALIGNFGKAGRVMQQSQYMTPAGDPAVFDPDSGKYRNALTGEELASGGVIRNYTKTITDPKTGEILEVRPGVGVVGALAGKPAGSSKVISKEDEKDYTYDMLNPKQRSFLKDAEKTYLSDIKDSRDFGEILANVEDLVSADISAAIPAIKRQLARSVGKEVGVMTDKDVEAFSGDQSLVGALQRFAKLKATGRMTETDKEQYAQIISLAKRNLIKAIDNRAGYHVSRLKTRLPDATPKSLRSLLSVEASKPMGLENPKLNAAEEWLSKNPDHPQAAAVKEKIERMRGNK